MLLLLAFICLGFSVGGIVIWIADRLGPSSESERRFLRFLIATLFLQGLGLVFVHGFLKWHVVSWREFLGLNARAPRQILVWALVVGVLAIPATMLLNGFIGWILTHLQRAPHLQPVLVVVQESGGGWQRASLAIATIGLAPVFEEALFRGILYPILKQSGFPRLALAGTSLLFGAIHLSLVTFLPLTMFAVVLALLYEKTDALLAPIIVHALFNAVNLVMLFAAAGKPMLTS